LLRPKVLIKAWRRHYNAVRPQQPGLSATGSQNSDTAIAAVRFRFALPSGCNGGGSNDALTKPDHSVVPIKIGRRDCAFPSTY